MATTKKSNTVRRKMEALADRYYDYEQQIQRLAEQIRPLSDLLKEFKANQDDVREELRADFIAGDFDRLSLGKCMVTRTSGRPSVRVIEKAKVPKKFKKITVDIDKNAVMKLYREEGKEVPGCEIVVGEPTIQIVLEKG